MSVYEVLSGMDSSVEVVLVRRDGYALCLVMGRNTVGSLLNDSPWNVVAWGLTVSEVIGADDNVFHAVALVIE